MNQTLTLLAAAVILAGSPAAAQTKTPARSTTTTANTTKTTTTSTARPASTTTTKPAASRTARPAATSTKTTTTARPAAAKPAARPAAAVAPVAPAATSPAPEPTPTTTKTVSSATSFAKGTVVANLGVGIGNGYGYGFGYGGALKATPALSLSVEKGIVEGVGPGVISVGGLIGYKGYHYDWSFYGDTYKASWKNFIVAARGAYHYNFTTNPKVDTYAGVSLGARIENYSNNYNGSDLNESYGGAYLTTGIFLGGRYFFTDNIGAFAELGYDMSYLKLGLSARF